MKRLLVASALLALLFAISCQEDDTILPPDDEPTSWLLELDGVSASLNFGQLALQNEDTLILLPLEMQESGLYGVSIETMETGEYQFTISLFLDEKSAEEAVSMKVYTGSEAIGVIDFGETPAHLLIRGPEGADADYQLEPEWSARNFQSYTFEDVPPMTMSFPQQLCNFDIRFVPNRLSRQPDYSYIDYFVQEEGGDPQSLGISECFGTCDIREQIGGFGEVVDEESRNLCAGNSWDLVDTMIMLNFGVNPGEFVIFYQRWDETGTVTLP